MNCLSANCKKQVMHTLVLGASTNPDRASNKAVQMLVERKHQVTAIGVRDGEIHGISIQKGMPDVSDVHTVTLYLNPQRQEAFYDYILGLKPQRIIFNPGTENAVFVNLAKENGIETEVACSLVMLTLGSY